MVIFRLWMVKLRPPTVGEAPRLDQIPLQQQFSIHLAFPSALQQQRSARSQSHQGGDGVTSAPLGATFQPLSSVRFRNFDCAEWMRKLKLRLSSHSCQQQQMWNTRWNRESKVLNLTGLNMEIYACKTKTEYSAHVYVTLYYVYIYNMGLWSIIMY